MDFRRSGSFDELVTKLRELIYEGQVEADGSDSQSAGEISRQGLLKAPNSAQIEETFKMAIAADFKNSELGKVLKKFYAEESSSELTQILASFSEHNDHAQLKKELEKFACENTEPFTSMNEAVDYFISEGTFNVEEVSILREL